MNRTRKTYRFFHLVSAIFMILTLLWVTVSIPFVTASRQELGRQHKIENSKSPLTGNEEEAAHPLSNTAEEKTPGTSSLSEEYLHESFIVNHFFSTVGHNYKCEDAGTYIAFYGELLVPPPNAA